MLRMIAMTDVVAVGGGHPNPTTSSYTVIFRKKSKHGSLARAPASAARFVCVREREEEERLRIPGKHRPAAAVGPSSAACAVGPERCCEKVLSRGTLFVFCFFFFGVRLHEMMRAFEGALN